MEYRAYIPYVNRRDFLDRAIDSLEFTVKDKLLLIDNSDSQELGTRYRDIPVFTPPVSLSFSQTSNLIQKFAIEQQVDFFIQMHSDASALRDRVEALFKKTEEAFKSEPAWAVVFTLYDTLCSYRVSAVQDIGRWDTTFPQYFADNDYFRRMRLKGYKSLEAGGDGIRHETSGTIRNDPARWWANENSFELYRELYKKKWGGQADEETYEKPYNKLPL